MHTRVLIACFVVVITSMITTSPVHAQWEKVPLPAPYDREYYLDVMFLASNPNYGWASSQERAVVRTVDGGLTWTGTMLPRRFLESVMFLSPTVGYVSGPAGIFRSSDGGQSFTDVTPVQMDIVTEKGWGCFFINEMEGMYFVDGCSQGPGQGGLQKFFRTTNGGASWTVYLAQEPSSGLSDGIIYRNGVGYASSSGIIWRTDDYGRSWHVFTQTGPKYWTEEITNINSTFLVPTAGTDCSGSFGDVGSLRWTSNNGGSWREFQTSQAMFGTFLIDERRGWGVGSNRAVYYSEDAGSNWVERNCGIEGSTDDIFFIDENTGWIAGDGLYRSIFDRKPQAVAIDPPDSLISFCAGETITVGGTTGLRDYSWSDGVKGASRILNKAGMFILSAVDPITCQTTSDTIRIAIYPATTPQIQASKTAVCFGDSVVLRAAGPYRSWSWSDSSTNESIIVSQSGTYTVVTVDTNGCTRVSTPYIVNIRPPVEPQISNSRPLTFCIDDSVTLSAPDGFVQYFWTTGETSKSIVVKTEGQYVVRVVDAAGCTGTSPPVTVTVLNIRNQIEVLFAPGTTDIVVPEHIVGQQRCTEITIRNRSDSTVLYIREPHLLRNVFCSIPLSQLPITIGPLGSLTLSICCSVLDSGIVYDTLELPDTCSSTFLPVRSRGLSNSFDGTSRCEVPVGALVYRAGSPYRLSNPFPVPAGNRIRMQVRTPIDTTIATPIKPTSVLSAHIVNTLGQTVAHATIVRTREGNEDVVDIDADIQHLRPALYSIAVVLSDQSVLQHMPFIKGVP